MARFCELMVIFDFRNISSNISGNKIPIKEDFGIALKMHDSKMFVSTMRAGNGWNGRSGNTRRLDYHPHVHLVMPAAAIDGARMRWSAKRPGKGETAYLFNHKVLTWVFRAKMLAAFAAAGLSLPARYPQKWLVDCKSVGNDDKALIYLGRYLYGRVISENDVVAWADGQVSFRYRDGRTAKTERRTMTGGQLSRAEGAARLDPGATACVPPRIDIACCNGRRKTGFAAPCSRLNLQPGRFPRMHFLCGPTSPRGPGSSKKRFRSWLRTI